MAPSPAPLLGHAPGYAAAMRAAIVSIASAVLLAGCGANVPVPDATATPRPTSRTATATPDAPSPAAKTARTTATTTATTGVRVTRVIDGDTLVVSTGATIRITGIDTPERGQCGYAEAAANLRRLTTGRTVVLSGSKRDRYGRLVRYVDAAGVDAGLAQIRAGLATARYDSRDGYGRHPRQDVYVAADAATPHVCAAATGG